MRGLIKKILREGEWDWLSDHEFDVDKVKVGDKFKVVDGDAWFEVDKIKWNETSPELSIVYIKNPDVGWETEFYIKDIIKSLNKGQTYDPNGLEKIEDKDINESDELDWIKDVEPPSYDSLVGKALYFDPPISQPQQLKSVIKPLKMLGFHHGTWVDDFINYGVESYEDDEIIGLYLRPDDGGITYTAWIDEDYEYHISEWAGEAVEVLDGWEVLQPFI